MGYFLGRINISEPESPTGPIDPWLWQVNENLTYVTDGGDQITVLRGAISDGASIPRPFWRIVGPPVADRRVLAAALIHDQLYETQGALTYTRAQVDEIFREALVANGVSSLRARVMWAAVRVGGFSGWHAHTPESVAEQMSFIRIKIGGDPCRSGS